MRTTADYSAAGRRSTRTGKDTERRFAEWLRTISSEFRQASVSQVHGRYGDLEGIGDRVSEITVMPYEKLTMKLTQAEQDAKKAGRTEYHVWKPIKRQHGEPGTVARSIVIYRAEVIWPMLARLDKLEQAEMNAQDSYDRGYTAGRAAALRELAS